MINLTIDNQAVSVPQGFSILDAANRFGIEIPTLCYLNGFDKYTSCMMCVVEDVENARLLPACTAPAMTGMQIATNNARVREARKDTLELLFSEHVGSCEAPCYRTCPAHMNIPLMIRQIRGNRFDEAIITVKQDIALPAILGRICSAPCENGCNRLGHDGAISVCALKRIVADVDLKRDIPYMPVRKKSSGKSVAIIGSGPTGLATAYYLLQEGHLCDIFDQNNEPGGMLRYGVPEDRLPRSVLNAEIDTIRDIGANFIMNQSLGKHISLNELQQNYDAVVLAIGAFQPELLQKSGILTTNRGIQINRRTFETEVSGVYAGGNAIAEGRMAIRSVAQGKSIAFSVDQQLNNLPLTGLPQRFSSLIGKIRDAEVDEFLQDSSPLLRVLPESGTIAGFSSTEAIDEANRCFHCDCRKSQSCKLRSLAEEYGVDQQKYKLTERQNLERIIQHGLLIYEPGKCIKCGLCVQITEKSNEKFGLTFIRRGFNVRIAVPFDEALGKGLEKVARECVETCPTAALAWLDKEDTG